MRSIASRPFHLAAALALLCASVPASAQPAPAAAPDSEQAVKIVEELHAVMLDAMKQGKQLGYEGRLAKLQPAIASRYDFTFMAEKSVGLAWKDFDDAQRAKLVDAMERLAGASYAARMKDFAGERFETMGVEPAAQSTVMVRSRIVESSGKATTLDYRLRATPAGPRIVDVFYDGTVSELALRRSEYSSLLKKGGFPTLIDAVEKKIAEQAVATQT